MSYIHADTPSGWTDALERLFRPHRTSLFDSKQIVNRRSRYPAGKIWRAALAQSVFVDLSTSLDSNGTYAACGGRRFVRLDFFGLTGVILYELPVVWRDLHKHDQKHGDCCMRTDSDARMEYGLTLAEVFGNTTKSGMKVDELLDRVSGKIIFTPAYACTSFVSGQVMNGLLYAQAIHPRPMPQGIATDASAFSFNSGGALNSEKPVMDVLAYLHSTSSSSSLPPRYFSSGSPRIENDCSYDETLDTSLDTIDSFGPSTPLRQHRLVVIASAGSPLSPQVNDGEPFDLFSSGSCANHSLPDLRHSLAKIDYVISGGGGDEGADGDLTPTQDSANVETKIDSELSGRIEMKAGAGISNGHLFHTSYPSSSSLTSIMSHAIGLSGHIADLY